VLMSGLRSGCADATPTPVVNDNARPAKRDNQFRRRQLHHFRTPSNQQIARWAATTSFQQSAVFGRRLAGLASALGGFRHVDCGVGHTHGVSVPRVRLIARCRVAV
jgi:hypothetical protein